MERSQRRLGALASALRPPPLGSAPAMAARCPAQCQRHSSAATGSATEQPPPQKILVISDIHGNAEALRAVMEAERDCDSVIFLGDSILSGPQVRETMGLLQSLHAAKGGTWIGGNHDEEMLHPELVENYPATWKSLNDWIFGQLVESDYEFVRANYVPEGDHEVGGIRMRLIHGTGPHGPERNALPDSTDERLTSMADAAWLGSEGARSDCPFVLFGHSHVQFQRVIDGVTYINPGSVGQSRTGKQIACYGVFLDGEWEFRQVGYDLSPFVAAFERACDEGGMDDVEGGPEFRRWLIDGAIEGFGIGKSEPWTTLSKQGYN